MATSFREYIEEKFFDDIYEELKSYIYKNKSMIPFKLSSIDAVHQAILDDAYFKKFYVHNYYNYDIRITIIVEAQVTLKQYKGGDCIDDYDYPWFLVKCECKLIDKITDFKVVNVETFDQLEKNNCGLTDNLIPYIKKEKMDEYATTILQHIYPQALNGLPIDPYEFAHKLGLTIKEVKFKNENQMVAIFFEECRSITKKGEIKITPANTIKIAKNTNFLGFEGCKNFTIMHECVHYLLHRRAFQLERLFNKKAKAIECHSNGLGITEAKTTPIDWMEWQANSLAPRLLMPVEPFKKVVSQLLDKYQIKFDCNDNLQYYEQVIYDLAEYFGAPVESVKIRLVELGYEFPLGCLISIDGIRVMPHAFSKGYLAKNETFSISDTDAAIYSFTEKYLNKNDLIAGYIYVDHHLCINHPQYIEQNQSGKLILSDYAVHHMDECCIKFEVC